MIKPIYNMVNHAKWINIDLIRTTDCANVSESDQIMDALKESINRVGFNKAITVRADVNGINYEIVNGYRRYLVGKEMGMQELPVIVGWHTRNYSRIDDQFEDKEWMTARE